jgi:hypothetical protein
MRCPLRHAARALIGTLLILLQAKKKKSSIYESDFYSGGGPGFGQTSGKHQGCQMEYFKTKNPNLGKFWRALEWKMFVYVRVIWNVYYGHLVYFIVSIW